MFYGASAIIFERAKLLRNNTTTAEKQLWSILSGKQLGVKFRRQHPIKDYIVDFYCHERKLIIELDGSIHQVEEIKENDVERQEQLENLGLNVIRFTNTAVKHHLNHVLTEIQKACAFG